MKKIGVVTATRAEYGLLKPVIQALIRCAQFEIEVIATGSHLAQEFGATYQEIERDGIPIAAKIPILDPSDAADGISRTMGNALIRFGAYFQEHKPDLLIVLGDRYEMCAICCAAVNARIPIAHLHGGETTEGAIDEAYRHAITKMSYLHFTSTEAYRRRVIQLGESPDRVFCVGATGVENARNMQLLTKHQLADSISFSLDKPYACVTFHPVTLEDTSAEAQMEELLRALDSFPDMQFIFTKANADSGGRAINRMIDDYAAGHGNTAAFPSLGMVRYLSAVKHSAMVIGNSSSGILEAPSFGIPTVNIGDRQKGRIQAESVINCIAEAGAIRDAICQARSPEAQLRAKQAVNPYGDGHTSERIVKEIIRVMRGDIQLKKKFYDLPQT